MTGSASSWSTGGAGRHPHPPGRRRPGPRPCWSCPRWPSTRETSLAGPGTDGAAVLESSPSTPPPPCACRRPGLAAAALALTAEYTKTREQFGKPIATFQAVGQRAADAYVDAEAIRLTAWQAAWRLSAGLPASGRGGRGQVLGRRRGPAGGPRRRPPPRGRRGRPRLPAAPVLPPHPPDRADPGRRPRQPAAAGCCPGCRTRLNLPVSRAVPRVLPGRAEADRGGTGRRLGVHPFGRSTVRGISLGRSRNRATSAASLARALTTGDDKVTKGARTTAPPAIDQVPTARPWTRATGRKMPLTVTTPMWAPSTESRDRQPSSRGSNGPSSRGGGSSAAGPRRARSTSPSGCWVSSEAIDRRPWRASPRGRPAHSARSRSSAGPWPARYRRASSARATGRSGGAGASIQSRTRTKAWWRPTIGPRTMSPRRLARTRRWTRACPLVGTPAAASRSASWGRVEGPSAAIVRSITLTPALRGLGRDALLVQATGVGRRAPGRRQGVEPPVVLGADQVQGATVQPGDHQGAVLGEGPVDRLDRQPGGPGSDGEAGAPWVLGLDGQEPLGDGHGAVGRWPGEQLGSEARTDQGGVGYGVPVQPTSSAMVRRVAWSPLTKQGGGDGLPPGLEVVTDLLPGPDQGDVLDHGGGHRRRRLVLVAVEVERPGSCGPPPRSPCGRRRRSGSSCPWPPSHRCRGRGRDGSRRRRPRRRRRSPSGRRRGPRSRRRSVGRWAGRTPRRGRPRRTSWPGGEEDGEPAVGDLGGQGDVLGSLGPQDDRDVGAQGMDDRLQRLAQAGAARVGQRVVGPVVGHRAPGGPGPGARCPRTRGCGPAAWGRAGRTSPRRPGARRPESEDEAPGREVVHGQGGHGHGRRGAGRQLAQRGARGGPGSVREPHQASGVRASEP